MCGISGFEFIIIVVAAIIILGPDKLPEMLRFAGKATRELRRWKGDLGDMTREIQRTIPVDELRQNIREELQLDRARARVKETEAEIDELRARLKKRVALEEGDSASARPSARTPADAQPKPVAGPPASAEAPVDPLLQGDAPATDKPMIGPQPRPMNTAGRGVRRPERAAAEAEGDAPDSAAADLPTLRPASGTHSHDRAPRPAPAAPSPADVDHPDEP